MTTQINLRVSDEFLKNARLHAKKQGYLNVQEFIREAAREKLYEVRPEYVEVLESDEAKNYLSDDEAEKFERELEEQAKK